MCVVLFFFFFFFFFNDTATTEIYTLSLHDALPISSPATRLSRGRAHPRSGLARHPHWQRRGDRKSTRLYSSHVRISYAVFCLKKKKINTLAYYAYKTKVNSYIKNTH